MIAKERQKHEDNSEQRLKFKKVLYNFIYKYTESRKTLE